MLKKIRQGFKTREKMKIHSLSHVKIGNCQQIKRNSKKESNGNSRAFNAIFEIKNSLCMLNSVMGMTEKRHGEVK